MNTNIDVLLKMLGERIRALRKGVGIKSQAELAQKAGLYDVGEIERGEINSTVLTLSKIADVLGVSVKDLFDFPGERKPISEDEQIRLEMVGLFEKQDIAMRRQVMGLLRAFFNGT